MGEFMKNIYKILTTTFIFAFLLSNKVFCANAYLEGNNATPEPSFLDNFDASLLMANWYKIVLIVVAVVCFVGFIVSNAKKSNK